MSECHVKAILQISINLYFCQKWFYQKLEVCETECLHRETYHLAIDYIDRFLLNVDRSKFIVNMENFQLIGTTALFMASKYEVILFIFRKKFC